MVRFHRLNLLTDFTSLGTFNVIFCRNVLIYFDQETKSDVLDRLGETTTDDGYPILGAAKTAIGLTHAFRMMADKPGLYTLSPSPSRLALHPRPCLVTIGGGR
jgi:chemotaxis protein methyltransferase CheR